MSWGGASTHGLSPTSINLGALPKFASVVANAFMSAPTGALSEKGKAVAEMGKRRQFLPYLVIMRGGRQ